MSTQQDFETFRQVGLHLPERVFPIYEYLEKVEPYAVIVCDRDARPIGAALESIRSYSNGLNSIGSRWYYKRVSKKIGHDALYEHLREPLEALSISDNIGPLVVIDDYVSNTAGTLHYFRRICSEFGITMPIAWVTMSGRGTAFNAYPYQGASSSAPWRDRPDVMGVDYEGTELRDMPSSLSTTFYAAIHQGVGHLFERNEL